MPGESEATPRILKVLKFYPRGITVGDLSKKIRINRNSAAKYLEMLRVGGQVEVRTYGSAKVYSLAQRVPLSAFLCFTKNLILILDEKHRIIQVNDQYLKLIGRLKEEILGQNLSELSIPILSEPEAQSLIETAGIEQVIRDIRSPRGDREDYYQMQVIPTTFEGGEKGLTILLEDITERKQYMRHMEFLTRTSMELLDLPQEADIYQYIAQGVLELVPSARFFVHSFDETKGKAVMRVIEDQKWRDIIRETMGIDFVGLEFPLAPIFSPPFHETPRELLQGGVREYVLYPKPAEGPTLFDYLLGTVPEAVCDRLFRDQDIGKAYITFLVWQERLFGVVGIFLPLRETLKDKMVIESFLRQASIAISRRMMEERLHITEGLLMGTLNQILFPSAILDSEGRYLYINHSFTEMFGYNLSEIPSEKEWLSSAPPVSINTGEIPEIQEADLQKGVLLLIRCKNGEGRLVRCRTIALPQGFRQVIFEEQRS
jgi:PAS domain S-box-containing protein